MTATTGMGGCGPDAVFHNMGLFCFADCIASLCFPCTLLPWTHRTMAERLVAKLDSTHSASHQQTPMVAGPTAMTDGYMPMTAH